MTLPGSNDIVDNGLFFTHLLELSLCHGEWACVVEKPDILRNFHLLDEAKVHQLSSWNLHVEVVPSEPLEPASQRSLGVSEDSCSRVVRKMISRADSID